MTPRPRPAALATLFGYDPRLCVQLPVGRRGAMRRLSAAWLLSCLLLAGPLGYAVFTLEHSLLLATGVASASFVLFVNMVRLTVAGGGLGPEATDAELAVYRPGLAPLGMLAVLSVLLAQPAQLPFFHDALNGSVEAQRALLVERHARVHASGDATAQADYARRLEQCDFLVWRLARLWDDPRRALPLAVVYVLLVLLPALWSRFVALDTLRDYERLRLAERRAATRRERARAEARVEAHLRTHPTYAPSERRGARGLAGGAR